MIAGLFAKTRFLPEMKVFAFRDKRTRSCHAKQLLRADGQDPNAQLSSSKMDPSAPSQMSTGVAFELDGDGDDEEESSVRIVKNRR